MNAIWMYHPGKAVSPLPVLPEVKLHQCKTFCSSQHSLFNTKFQFYILQWDLTVEEMVSSLLQMAIQLQILSH